MAPRLVRCSRVPRVPIWAAAIALAWGCAVWTAHLLSQRTGLEVSTCLFKWATGIPCPTCGGTRVVVRAADGDLARSFAANPAVFVAIAVTLGLLLLRVVAARRIEFDLGPRGRNAALVAALLVLLLDWAYLIANGI
jgi:hypothetical protein